MIEILSSFLFAYFINKNNNFINKNNNFILIKINIFMIKVKKHFK